MSENSFKNTFSSTSRIKNDCAQDQGERLPSWILFDKKKSKNVSLCQNSGSEKNNNTGKGSKLGKHEVMSRKVN